MGRDEWERAFHYFHLGPTAGNLESGAGQGKNLGVCRRTELTWDSGVLGFSPGSAL